MHNASRSRGKQNRYWTKALHLFYAGLYAFVLPLICWGAQATPGHPHARAHFVFANPPIVDPSPHAHLDQATNQVVHTLVQWLTTYSGTTNCSVHNEDTTPEPIDLPQVPAGRSVPSQLAIATLLPLGMNAAFVPCNADGAQISVWLADSLMIPFSPPIPTPPPRLSAAFV